MFVRTTTGTVFNSDHINEIHEVREGKRPVQHKAYLSDGSPIGILADGEMDALCRIDRMLPAQPNDLAIVVTPHCPEDDSPATVTSEMVPIVGWIIEGPDHEPRGVPILSVPLEVNDRFGLLLPDGRVVELPGAPFNNRTEFERLVLAEFILDKVKPAQENPNA